MRYTKKLTLLYGRIQAFVLTFLLIDSIIECGSFCVITPGCLAFLFNKENKTCKLGNGTGLMIQTNHSFVEGTIHVHVKQGLVMATNGN
jgi:hypothetical protein